MRQTPQELPCSHPKTSSRPVIIVSSPKPTCLRSVLRQSSVHATNTRRGITRPVVPIAQCPQRVDNRVAPIPCLTPQILSSCRPTTAPKVEPVESIKDKKINLRKQRARRARARNSEVTRDIPAVQPIAISNEAKSIHKDALRPSELELSSEHSTHRRRDVTRPLISTTQRPRRTGKTVKKPCDKARAEGGNRRALVPTAQPETGGVEIAQTRARKSCRSSVQPSTVGSSQSSVSKCDPKNNPINTEVKPPTVLLKVSHGRVIASRPSQEVVSQIEPERGGRPLSNDRRKPTFNELMDALCGAMDPNTSKLALEDVFLPPIRTAMICPTARRQQSSPICVPRQFKSAVSGEPREQLETTIDDMLVFQDISHPSFARLRQSSSFRPRRRQDFCVKAPSRDFLTSTPRRPLASPLSPFRVRGAKVIVHSHARNSNISCFLGCELRAVRS